MVRVETRWANAPAADDRVTWRVNGEGQPRPQRAGGDRLGWSSWETRDLHYGENSFLVTVQPPESGGPCRTADPGGVESLDPLRVRFTRDLIGGIAGYRQVRSSDRESSTGVPLWKIPLMARERHSLDASK